MFLIFLWKIEVFLFIFLNKYALEDLNIKELKNIYHHLKFGLTHKCIYHGLFSFLTQNINMKYSHVMSRHFSALLSESAMPRHTTSNREHSALSRHRALHSAMPRHTLRCASSPGDSSPPSPRRSAAFLTIFLFEKLYYF